MAKKGGIFQAMGNLVRWTIWGLAALAVIAIWLGWSNRANGPDTVTATVEEPATTQGATDAESAVAEPASDAGEASEEQADDGVAEAASELGEAAETVADTVGDAMQSATEEATDEAEAAAEQAEETVQSAEEEVTTAVEGAVSDDDADLNVVPEEFSEIRVPGDDAVYGLVSVFQRDDGSIEVVSSKTEGGTEVLTTRLVTCAPLAVGVIAEGDGPRNDNPELERIPLGSAASLIAGLACGAMN